MENNTKKQIVADVLANVDVAYGHIIDCETSQRKHNMKLFIGNVCQQVADDLFALAEENAAKLKNKVNATQTRLADVDAKVSKLKDEATGTLLEMRLKAIYASCMSSAEVKAESLKRELAEIQQKIDQSEAVFNPYLGAVQGVIDLLKNNDVPKEQWGQIITEFIHSGGYLQWQANKTETRGSAKSKYSREELIAMAR